MASLPRIFCRCGSKQPVVLRQAQTRVDFSTVAKTTLYSQQATTKQIKARVKKQWNRENLQMFGPLLNAKTRQKNRVQTKSSSPLPNRNNSGFIFSDNESYDASLKFSPESLTDASISDKLESIQEHTNERGSISHNFKHKLQVMLQFPLSPPGDTTSPVFHDALKEISDMDEFQMDGMYAHAYPSVSKILEKSRPPESAFYLERWMKNMIAELGKEGFEKHQKETRDRGSAFHQCVTAVLQGMPLEEIEIPPSVEPLWNSLAGVLPDFELAQFVESPVRHPTLHYSGIFDCVAAYKGCVCLIDWKISKTQKPALSSTFDNPLQLAAYIGALNFDERYNTQVEKGLLVIAYDDGQPAHIHPMAPQQCQYYWGQWLRRLHAFWAGVMAGDIRL